MKRNFLRLAALLGSLLFVGAYSAFAFEIDDTGGDCDAIGIWELGTMTCTLTQDVSETIVIGSDGVTLDGDGYLVHGAGMGDGIFLLNNTGVTIKSVKVGNFTIGIYLYNSRGNTLKGNTAAENGYCGIYLYNSSGNTLTGNTAADNNYGIRIFRSNNNTLTENTVSNNIYYGIYLYNSSGNTLTENTVSNNVYYGIYLHYYSRGNTLTGNTVSDHDYGIYLYNSRGNQIYQNNFIENVTQAYSYYVSTNVFNQDPPIGGNHWSDYPGVDNDGDGFGDTPYAFYGGQDNLPWVVQNGWDSD